MLPRNLSRSLLLCFVVLVPSRWLLSRDVGSSARHFGATNLDTSLSCISKVYGKPVTWDSVDTNLLIHPCPSTQAALQDSLAKIGLRVFETPEFVFVIPAKMFQAAVTDDNQFHSWLKWSALNIHLNLQSLEEGEELPPGASGIAKNILNEARLIPLPVSKLPDVGYPNKGQLDAELNIAIWVGRLGPGDQRSVVACINGRPLFSTARLVYGELHNDIYVMLWDSPLFNVLHGNIYFQDVNGDNSKEIVVESSTYGNKEYPILAIFDKSGREITRQKQCDTRDSADGNFGEENGVCAVYGTDIAFSDNEEGPKDIRVSGWYGDRGRHVFKLLNGLYVPGSALTGGVGPATAQKSPDPAELNEQGIKLMHAMNYAGAEVKFQQASLSSGDKNPEYANNVGFALYKQEKYDLAISWFKKTIQLDPQRAVAYLNLGDVYAKLNRNAEARGAYGKYLDLVPDSKSAADVKKKLDVLPISP
jgi:TPR repeat